MNYGAIKNCDIANGEGVRVSLFVSGCRNHCPGCFQPETWDFRYGQLFTTAMEAELLRLLEPRYINGLTLLGGALGTDPRRLPEYFAAHGVACLPCKKGALTPGVYLCSYTAMSLLKEGRGLHTVALHVTASGMAVYNQRDDDASAVQYPMAQAFFRGKTVVMLLRVTAEAR